MTRLDRNVNLLVVFLPPLLVLAAIPVFWGSLVTAESLAIAVVMYLITGFGITVGYHRLMTHRAFATHRVIECSMAIAGSLALEGSPCEWVADHRKHHAHTDEEGDPHSPHAGHGSGFTGAMRGLWHAHVGWLWKEHGRASVRRYAPELAEDKFMRALHRQYFWMPLLTLLIPAGLGFALSGTLKGALLGLLWGGLIRVMAVQHITWSVNSVCHFFGDRRFDIEDHSTNVFWLALPSLGEAWHHNHHAFARSAFHGLKGWEAALDPSGWVIRGMRRIGLAWNVVQITPERQASRLAVAGSAPGTGS